MNQIKIRFMKQMFILLLGLSVVSGCSSSKSPSEAVPTDTKDPAVSATPDMRPPIPYKSMPTHPTPVIPSPSPSRNPSLSPSPSPSPSPSQNSSYTVFQQKTLAEINLARTNPAGYAEVRLKSDYAAGTDNGAYQDLRGRTAVGAVDLQPQLCAAATNYAAYMAQKNVFGHSEQGTPESRCIAAGYSYYSGENIAANGWDYCNAESDPETAAIRFIQQLIIDQGVSSLGHRNNIMSGYHKKLGIGFARNPNSSYQNYTVQDFGSK